MNIETSGSAYASCDKCGWFDSWEWAYEQERPELPTTCPDCEQGPILKRLKARFNHWKAMRRFRQPNFIDTIWTSEVQEVIEASRLLGQSIIETTYDGVGVPPEAVDWDGGD